MTGSKDGHTVAATKWKKTLAGSRKALVTALIGVLTMVLVLTASSAFTPENKAFAELTGGSCGSGLYLEVPGTWETKLNDNNNPKGMLKLVYDQLRKSEPGVRGYSVDYPAEVGGLAGVATKQKSPIADSVKIGIQNVTKAVKTYLANCPGKKVVADGYSQGALVLGDWTALVGNEGIEGIDPERIAGVALYADPRRSPTTVNGADSGPRVRKVGAEKMISRSQIGGTGIFGYRSTYGKLSNRVVSFCAPNKDAYCSIPAEARGVADFVAALAEYDTGTNSETRTLVQQLGFGKANRAANDGNPVDQGLAAADLFASGDMTKMIDSALTILPKLLSNPVAFIQNPGSATKLLNGITVQGVASFAAAISAMSSTKGHGAYPNLVVNDQGTTATQWGGNWLAARLG